MKHRQAAFTLFEVLIAVLILSIGLLGLAGLQAAGMRNNNDAYMRSQASVLAYDMADRIRSNRTSSFTGSGTENADCLSTTGCTPAQMAAHDIFEWQAAVANTLPLGAGTIGLSGGVYTIQVSWDDSFSGSAGQTFSTSFIP